MTVYECAFRYRVGADDFFNVVHYDITGDDPPDLQDLTDEIVAAWAAGIGDHVAAAVTFNSVIYRLDIDGSVGVEVIPTGGPEPGTATVNNWAGQMAVLLQKKTNGIVRPNLGRMFIPGVFTSALTAGGEWSVDIVQAAEAFGNAIVLISFAGNGVAQMLIKASNPTAPNTNAYNEVAECNSLAIPSALQSRKKGRGA